MFVLCGLLLLKLVELLGSMVDVCVKLALNIVDVLFACNDSEVVLLQVVGMIGEEVYKCSLVRCVWFEHSGLVFNENLVKVGECSSLFGVGILTPENTSAVKVVVVRPDRFLEMDGGLVRLWVNGVVVANFRAIVVF